MAEDKKSKSKQIDTGINIKADLTKPAAQATNTVVKAAEFVGRVLGEPLQQFGGMLGDMARDWRAGNLERISAKWRAKLESKGVSDAALKALPPGMGLRVIEAASMEDEDEVQELWAGLISSSMQGATPSRVHVDILRSISALEAKILRFQWLRLEAGDISGFTLSEGAHSEYLDKELRPVSVDDRAVAVLNLVRAGCLRRVLDQYHLDQIFSEFEGRGLNRQPSTQERLETIKRLFQEVSGQLDEVFLGLSPGIENRQDWLPEIAFELTELGKNLLRSCES